LHLLRECFGFFGDKLIEYVQEDEVVGVLRPIF